MVLLQLVANEVSSTEDLTDLEDTVSLETLEEERGIVHRRQSAWVIKRISGPSAIRRRTIDVALWRREAIRQSASPIFATTAPHPSPESRTKR